MENDTIAKQLSETLAMLLDLHAGYPVAELHQSIGNALDRAQRAGIDLSEHAGAAEALAQWQTECSQ